MQEEERTTLGKPVELSGTKCICEPGLKFNNLYNKRACSQTMLKMLRLRRQHCQIKRITGLQKTFWQERERELEIKIRGWGGGTLATHG